MRVLDETSGTLFCHIDFNELVPARHPLRKMRQIVCCALASLHTEFNCKRHRASLCLRA